jgi:phage-related protein
MGKSYFIWKGMDCRNMGITLGGPVAIVRPEERATHIEIPGRSGDLTQLQGENIFNSYIQTTTIQVKGSHRVRDAYRWLRGSGYVTFSGEPDRRQPARIIGAITLDKYSHNVDIWVGEIQFYCQPLKEKLVSETVEITSSGSAINNTGDVTSKPKITATASDTSMTIVAGGNTLQLTGLTSGVSYVIDSEIMEVLLAEGVGYPLTKNSIGEFPVLLPGTSIVTGTGWSKLVIDKRERFL